MLSVCIPIYNFDIRALVADLHEQLSSINNNFEILLTDDGSQQEYQQMNRECKILQNVRYEELSQNVGRSRIRNLLAEKAIYEYIIFLDCDTLVARDNFISNYILEIKAGSQVVCGGHIYHKVPPADDTFLHWYYGNKREAKNAEYRSQNPYHSFMTGNFLIQKKIFCHIRFSETLTTYGHEDTLFGCELQKQEIPIIHIDNPVVHLGLESNIEFLNKTRQALVNLLVINPVMEQKNFSTDGIRVLNSCNKLCRMGLHLPVSWLFGLFRKKFQKNLLGEKPSLFLLDLYKLGFLCRQKIRFGKPQKVKPRAMSQGNVV